MWSIKYRPSRVEEMIGNEDARVEFVKWLLTWKVGTKPVLLIGPPGTGKTTLVKTTTQLGFDLIELNASDNRTKDRLEGIIKPLIANASILNKKSILFLDEVDGIHGNADRGGLSILISFVKDASIPIVMAANTDENIKELMKACKVIRFKDIPPRLISLYLDHILRKENVSMSKENKMAIIRESKGDIRNVLNAASSSILLGSKGYEHESKVEISIAINRFFNAKDINDARDALSSAEGFYYDPRFTYNDKYMDKLEALFSSIINNTNDVEKLADMLNVLSYADLLIGRMSNTREWRMLRYIDVILANSLFKNTRGFTYYQYSLQYQISNKIFMSEMAINKFVSMIANMLGISKHEILLFLPYLLFMLKGKIQQFLEANDMDKSIAQSLENIIEHGND